MRTSNFVERVMSPSHSERNPAGGPERPIAIAVSMGDPAGIEIYAVCGRRPLKTDAKVREKAMEELAQKEFEIVAKRHLRDLRQDAHIEFR